MPYYCDLSPGQKIYLDNSGPNTVITLASGEAGQQQQSSTQVRTGPWTEVPQITRVGGGVLLRCVTVQGIFVWQVQGTQIRAAPATAWAADQATPMQATEVEPPIASMPPMPPMPPMQMGDMEMSLNPMTLRMREMTLGSNTPTVNTQKFCTQCGAAIAQSDRFCGSCGHQLS
ncbi:MULTISPECIES: zinc ribbon domain-containing protein [Cyanophyceae]|uniref:zinc ribbon domain-containing protein n=1 Tax=Cyanophyceae TaxID=3028117 RepID=UPI0016829114|nr:MULTISPECIES: zinc ribbon domain-containing protein [Cyanophyceae]MBD1917568.1 zinc ribbon domain-containing protein [Phormidium sp. FACHB-77]MBD2029557.1 zinc ribbon domain-containing protein [Phormidium sp. FACHB-322]MBD2050818.1 zinc ribbon domain-containing protein [Leptolyngbya sp. FACHB-60]